LIDVVHLRDVNDQFGREVGDEALRHVVRVARTGLRPADVLFRYRNDEFIALLTGADLDAAKTIARQIRESVKNHPMKTASGLHIPVEVKVSPLVADGTSFSDYIASARRQMAEAGSPKPIVH
jgi:diguanylate cyclase (GGDEF)-like protein